MFYDVGSISNRNIQLLYKYRILREPSENLTAICRGGEPIKTSSLKWVLSDRNIDGFSTVYVATLSDTRVVSNCVPFMEFHPNSDSDWKWISDFIDVEVTDTSIRLYSTTDYLKTLPIDIYWCYSLRHIDSLLKDILEDLNALEKEYDKLESDIKNFKDDGSYLRRPVGLIPNLVKIHNKEDETELVDSLYMIMTAESNRLFVNYSQDNLNTMEHIFNQSVEFRFLDKDHYVLDSFVCPVIVISGNGDLVLRNIQGQVVVTKWEGTLTIIDCPEVHLSATEQKNACQLKKLQISRRSTVYLENYIHKIEELEMFADSICRHWRANVKNISYVGPGCTYWCCSKVSVPGRVQLEKYSDVSNTVFDFNIQDIIGMFLTEFDNMMIIGQRNLTTRLGNCDPEPIPTMYVPKWVAHYTVTSGGSGGSGGGGGSSGGSVPGGTSDKEKGWYLNDVDFFDSGIQGWYSMGVGKAMYTVYAQGVGYWQDRGSFWNTTYSAAGCGPTSTATLLTGYGKNITPYETGEGIKDIIGGNYDGALWKGVVQEMCNEGVPATGVDTIGGGSSLGAGMPKSEFKAKAISLLSGGTPVIVNVTPGSQYGPRGTSAGHFFPLLDYDSSNDTAFIGDPAYKNTNGDCCGFYPLDTILSGVQALFWPTS